MLKIFMMRIKGIIFILIIFYLPPSNSATNSIKISPIFKLHPFLPDSEHNNSQIVQEADYFQVASNQLKEVLREKPSSIQFEVFFMNKEYVITLYQTEILTSDAKLVSGTKAGDINFLLSTGFISYSGKTEGTDPFFLTVSFSSQGLFGIIHNSTNDYIITSANSLSNLPTHEILLFSTDNFMTPLNFICGTELFEIPEAIQQLMSVSHIKNRRNYSNDLLEIEIALETDYETYAFFNYNEQDVSAYLLSLIATVSAIYTRDINIQIKVPYLRVWTVAEDPYEGENSSELLNEFRIYWNSQMQSIQRDLAHFITVRSGGLGGIAYLDVLCSTNSFGYAFSNINGRFSNLPTYSWDIDVVAHEIGHNFGSVHTHSCSWPDGPIDTCVVTEENEHCVSTPSSLIGTIMSYCHQKRKKILNFHPLPIAVMRNRAETASCLKTTTAPITIFVPNGEEIFYTDSEMTIIWGSNLEENGTIQFSPDGGVTWIDIASDISLQNRQYVWTVPYIQTTTNALIRIKQNSNEQIADISDAPFTIKTKLRDFTTLAPPSFSSFLIDSDSLRFRWTSAGNMPGVTYRIRFFTPPDRRTYWFADNLGHDTVATLIPSEIDSIMTKMNMWDMGDSVWVRWHIRSYLAYDSLQSYPIHQLNLKRKPNILVLNNNLNHPEEFKLGQNFPNPFNGGTEINFVLGKNTYVDLAIFTLLGQKIKQLIQDQKKAGSYRISWDGTDFSGNNLPSGVFLYRLKTDLFKETRKMIYLR